MTRGQFRTLAASALVALMLGPGHARAQSGVTVLDSVGVLGYYMTVPRGWVPRSPSSSSRLAQFVLSGSDSANSAEVVVFFFGKTQGANIDANLARWRGQFSTPDGSPVPERVTRDSAGAFPITIAEFRGTYRRGIGAGMADSVRTRQALVAAIVETPRGPLFIQLFGAAGRVVGERDVFIQFVKGLR